MSKAEKPFSFKDTQEVVRLAYERIPGFADFIRPENASEPKAGIDLAKFSLDDLKKISQIKGVPQEVLEEAGMLAWLRESGWVNLESKGCEAVEWTVPVSPRTKDRILKLVSGG